MNNKTARDRLNSLLAADRQSIGEVEFAEMLLIIPVATSMEKAGCKIFESSAGEVTAAIREEARRVYDNGAGEVVEMSREAFEQNVIEMIENWDMKKSHVVEFGTSAAEDCGGFRPMVIIKAGTPIAKSSLIKMALESYQSAEETMRETSTELDFEQHSLY